MMVNQAGAMQASGHRGLHSQPGVLNNNPLNQGIGRPSVQPVSGSTFPQQFHQNAWIELTPMIHVPVSSVDIKNESMQALEEIHLYSFLHEDGVIPIQFKEVLNNTMMFEDPNNMENLHPIVYFLAGMTRESLESTVEMLGHTTPINIIMNKVNSMPVSAAPLDEKKDLFLQNYLSFVRLSGGFIFY